MTGWDDAAIREGGSLRKSDGRRLAVAALLALGIDALVLASLSVLLAGAARAAASGVADTWVSVQLEDGAPVGTELERIPKPTGTELTTRTQEPAISATSSVPVTGTANVAAGPTPALGTELGAEASSGAAAATDSGTSDDGGASIGARATSAHAGTELDAAPIATREDILVRLDEAIKRKLQYPPRARERGIEGRVLLEILVDEGGSLRNCAVETSSGSPMLDTAARRLLSDIFPLRARLVAPFSAFVAVEYRLR
jgi:TonB family protein